MAHGRSKTSEADARTFAGVLYELQYDLRAPARWDDPELAHRSLFRQCIALEPQHTSVHEWLDEMVIETMSNFNLKKFVKEWVVLAFGAQAVFIERETTRAEAETFWRVLRALVAGNHPAALLDELSGHGSQPHRVSEADIEPDLQPHAHGHDAATEGVSAPELEEDDQHKKAPMDIELDDRNGALADAHVAHSQSIQHSSAGNAYPRPPAPRERSESPELFIFVKSESEVPVLPPARHRRSTQPKRDSEGGIVNRSGNVADSDVLQGDVMAQDVNHTRRGLVWKDYPAPKYANNPQPMPTNMRPRVWASTRTDFCETIPWFRSHQSGVYSRNNITYGYMVGGTPAPRDLWMHNGKLIVSHGGGSPRLSKDDETQQLDGDEGEQLVDDSASVTMSPLVTMRSELEPEAELAPMDVDDEQALNGSPGGTKRKGKRARTVIKGDQAAQMAQVDPIVHSAENGHPILLLVDRDYERFPWVLSEKQKLVVLGWYWIKAHWEEAEPAKDAPLEYRKRIKIAFQWVEGQGDPWWIPRPALSSLETQNVALTDAASGVPSRRRKLFSVEIKKPAAVSSNVERCSTCGSVSPLIYVEGWMCLTSICREFWKFEDGSSPHGEGLTYDAQFLELMPTPPHLRVALPSYEPEAPPKNPMYGLWCNNCGIASCRSRWEGWECDVCGTKLHAAHRVLSAKSLAPIGGDSPCGIWTMNPVSGITATQSTHPIEERGSLMWINRFTFPAGCGVVYHMRGNDAVNHAADDILLRYQRHFADSHLMRRLDLGQTTAQGTRTKYFAQNFGVPYKYVATMGTTISFDQAPSCVTDSRALIQDRMRLVGQGVEFNELLVAQYLPGQQMGYYSDVEPGLGETIASLSLGAPAEMKFKSRWTAGKHPSVTARKADTLLTIRLYHGDVLVMHGAGLQKNYEHQVTPEGFRIAAIARLIENEAGQ